MELQSPENIYASVSNEVDVILAKLKTLSSDKEIASAKEQAEEIFRKLSAEIKENIRSLKHNAEWDTFTIAFYGETNAGKSTIIETMRLLLDEPGKLKQQEEFRAMRERLGITPARLDALASAVAEAKAKYEQISRELERAEAAYDSEIERIDAQLQVLQQAIQEHKRTASLWRKLLDLFIELPEQKQSSALEAELRTRNSTWRAEAAGLAMQQGDAKKKHEANKRSMDEANAAMAQLSRHADGAIIGDGRSDHTRDAISYEFSANGQKFALLDLPGIEGKEGLVIDNIWAGVKKAHAVFYVAGKAAAPQKGDGANPGTLEKIRQQLGAQTEVWSVFNKRINNPIQLQKPALLDDDEKASLRVVDEKMAEVLGENYRGTIALSAHPAFLASASCFLPDSEIAKGKAKFASKFSEEELLRRSGMTEFHDIVVDKLVQDSKAKIIRANFNKAHGVVIEASGTVAASLNDKFKPLAEELAKDAQLAQTQLDMSLDALRGRLESRGEGAINELIESVREAIYAKIDGDIDNDDFRDAFQRILRNKQEALVEQLPGLMQKEVDKFQAQTRDVIERFENFAADLSDTYGNISSSGLGDNFDLKIKLGNGIDFPGLLGALVGAALMAWNPASWVVLALGAAGVVVGAFKALRSLFDSRYKRSQQRQAADSNLSGIEGQMRSSLRETLKSALPQLQPKVDAIKDALEFPARQVEQVAELLGQAERQLNKISNTIKIAGAL